MRLSLGFGSRCGDGPSIVGERLPLFQRESADEVVMIGVNFGWVDVDVYIDLEDDDDDDYDDDDGRMMMMMMMTMMTMMDMNDEWWMVNDHYRAKSGP